MEAPTCRIVTTSLFRRWKRPRYKTWVFGAWADSSQNGKFEKIIDIAKRKIQDDLRKGYRLWKQKCKAWQKKFTKMVKHPRPASARRSSNLRKHAGPIQMPAASRLQTPSFVLKSGITSPSSIKENQGFCVHRPQALHSLTSILTLDHLCYLFSKNISYLCFMTLPSFRSRAFSLLELLVVIAILSLLLAMTGPAINSFATSGATNRSIADLTNLIEQARAVAMAKNTYTWLGLVPSTGVGKEGVAAQLLLSPDGTGIGTSAAPLTKKILLNRVKLDDAVPTLGESTRPTASQRLSSNGGWLIFAPTGDVQASTATNPSLETLPSFVAGAAISRWIEIGLSSYTGRPGNEAALQVSGLSGKMMVYRR